MGYTNQDPGCCCTPTPTPTCTVTICAVDCAANPIPGAAVTVQTGSGPVSGITSTPTGCVSLDIGSAASDDVEVSASGYETFEQVMSLLCSHTYTIPLISTSTGCAQINIQGCNTGNLIDGFAIMVIGGVSYPTDSGGNLSVCGIALAGTYPFSITATAGFDPITGTVTVASNCASPAGLLVEYTMTVSTGYQCCGDGIFQFNIPSSNAYPLTLTLTDSVYGGCALTYTAGVGWFGTLNAVFGGGIGCPPAAITLTYTWCPAGGGNTPLAVTYTLAFFPHGCPGMGGGAFSLGAATLGTPTDWPLFHQSSIAAGSDPYISGVTFTVTP